MNPDISLAPIDCGFDPRVHGMACAIPSTVKCVRYGVRDSYAVRDVTGSIEHIIATLCLHGYTVKIEYVT